MENERIAQTRLDIITLYNKIDKIYSKVAERAEKIKKYYRKMQVNLDEAKIEEDIIKYKTKLNNLKELRRKNSNFREFASKYKRELKDIEKKIRKRYLNKSILNDEDEVWFNSINLEKYQSFINQNQKLLEVQDGDT